MCFIYMFLGDLAVVVKPVPNHPVFFLVTTTVETGKMVQLRHLVLVSCALASLAMHPEAARPTSYRCIHDARAVSGDYRVTKEICDKLQGTMVLEFGCGHKEFCNRGNSQNMDFNEDFEEECATYGQSIGKPSTTRKC
jgi:hypothetical protein